MEPRLAVVLYITRVAQNGRKLCLMLPSVCCRQMVSQRTRMKYFCAQVHTNTDSSDAHDLTAIATRRGRDAGIVILRSAAAT